MKLLAALILAVNILFSAASTTPAAWLGPDPHQAVTGLPGAPAWTVAVAAVAPGAAVTDSATAAVEEVQAFFAGLSAEQQAALARQAPGVVGNLDGVPAEVRYAANGHARDVAAALDPAAQLLGYDPRGDGRLTLVLGDLDTARHVAVVVPGSGWTLGTVVRHEGPAAAHPVTNARALYDEILRQDPAAAVAVVMWLDYDAPEDVDRQAARSERATAGARELTRLVRGLPRGAHVTLLCHSYGAVVCGRAAPTAPVDDIAVVAAPGMDVATAAALGTAARVWAARAAGDPIWVTPDVRLAGWGHGTDPTAPAFGARPFATGTARGHDGYYTPGTESLTNLARIALDHPTEVTA